LRWTAIGELDARSGHEIFDGLRDEDVARSGMRSDSCADRNGDTGNLSVHDLSLAGMQTGPELESQLGNRVADGARAADRPGRAVEAREEAVACGVQLDAAVVP